MNAIWGYLMLISLVIGLLNGKTVEFNGNNYIKLNEKIRQERIKFIKELY